MKKEYLIYKLSEDLKEATRIENELFRKFDVKRGLRNEDGTGRALCPSGIFASAFADGRFFTASAHQPTPHPEFSDREVCLPHRQAVRRFLPVRR